MLVKKKKKKKKKTDNVSTGHGQKILAGNMSSCSELDSTIQCRQLKCT